MPSTSHKFLIYGPKIIDNVLLPIGQLSKKAHEARNKDLKYYREYFSRKYSREKSYEDILNRFLLSSDPVISHVSEVLVFKENIQFGSDSFRLTYCF